MERNFLIVAADAGVRQALSSDLRQQGYSVTLAANGIEAERVVQSVSVDRVLVESHLPDVAADELRGRLQRARPGCQVVVLSSFDRIRNSPEMLRFGADDYVVASGQIYELLGAPRASRDAPPPIGLDKNTQSLIQVIDVLVGLLELEHRNFASSSHQAMQLARATAEEIGVPEEMLLEVVLGTLLRDIGKSEVDPDHRRDEDVPNAETRRRISEQVTASLRLFEHIDFPLKVLPVVRHHHEHYDGSGTPDGLRGREIPMGSRIVAVVDAYVEMTGGREEDAVDPKTALGELVRRAAHQFDPEVVEAFHRVMDRRLAARKAKGKPTVLIMDRQRQFRRLLKMRLLNEGLRVDEATKYAKALERVLKYSPDLLLVDADADVSEAFQLLHELQQDERLCQLPIAFLAQRPDRMLKIRALRQGVDDILVKSDDMEEIVARIENILIRKALRSDGEPRQTRRGITGDLENLSLPDIVQTLTIGMKTASVGLSSEDRSGTIWFENGVPKHASTDDLEGESAFYEMVRWKTGEFVIEHNVRCEESTLGHDSMFLLMEGLRLIDEESDPDRQAFAAS